MYLTKLELINFQCYRKEIVKFSPNLNCIIGRNDRGKTTLVRALKFLFYNEWDNSFIRKGKTSTLLKGRFDNGNAILRQKGENVNIVKIKTKEGIKKWQNFGTDLPDEVKRYLGMSHFYLGLDQHLQLNISDQLDKPFLVLESDSLKAKAISRLAQLHFFDLAISELNRESRNDNQQLHRIENEVKETEGKLESYKNIDLLKEKIKEVEKQELYAEQLSNRIESLTELQSQYSNLRKQNKTINRISETLNQIDLSPLKKVMINLEGLGQLSETYENLLNQRNDISRIGSSLEKAKGERERLSQRVKEKYLQLKICPFCGSKVSNESLKEIYQ